MDGGNQPNSVPFKRNIHKGFCGKEQKEKKRCLRAGDWETSITRRKRERNQQRRKKEGKKHN